MVKAPGKGTTGVKERVGRGKRKHNCHCKRRLVLGGTSFLLLRCHSTLQVVHRRGISLHQIHLAKLFQFSSHLCLGAGGQEAPCKRRNFLHAMLMGKVDFQGLMDANSQMQQSSQQLLFTPRIRCKLRRWWNWNVQATHTGQHTDSQHGAGSMELCVHRGLSSASPTSALKMAAELQPIKHGPQKKDSRPVRDSQEGEGDGSLNSSSTVTVTAPTNRRIQGKKGRNNEQVSASERQLHTPPVRFPPGRWMKESVSRECSS